MEISNIENDFVVLSPDKVATPITNSPSVFEQLHQSFGDFNGHELISCFTFSENWESWEIHPHGDEIICLLSGAVTFILDIDGEHKNLPLTRAGDFIIVPKGTWHTAQVDGPAKVLFITPGEGTRHKES